MNWTSRSFSRSRAKSLLTNLQWSAASIFRPGMTSMSSRQRLNHFTPKLLRPGIVLPEFFKVLVALGIQGPGEKSCGFIEKQNCMPCFCAARITFSSPCLFVVGQRFPPAVGVRAPMPIVGGKETAVAVHQEVHLVLDQNGDFRKILLGIPRPALDAADFETGLLAFGSGSGNGRFSLGNSRGITLVGDLACARPSTAHRPSTEKNG